MTTWDKVKKGDKITVKHDCGATIEGVLDEANPHYAKISGLNYWKEDLTIIRHSPSYEEGDIGLLFHDDDYFVGVYNAEEEAFFSNTGELEDGVPQMSGDEKGIKIVGNIKEYK